MIKPERNHTTKTASRVQPRVRKALVVHDGSAFQLAADLRRYGLDVVEGPLFSAGDGLEEGGGLAVIATRSGTTRDARLRQWTHRLCWTGSPVLAVGAAIAPVAEFFGSSFSGGRSVATDRLVDVCSEGKGLFMGLPSELRLALPAGPRHEASALSAELSATAWSKDGQLIGASHVFRPVHLLHAAVLESRDTRAVVLENLLRLLREQGGRAFGGAD